MKNFDIPKTVLNYELCVNPANAELLTMYQYTCEDFGREKSQDEDGDESLVLNLAKKPKLSKTQKHQLHQLVNLTRFQVLEGWDLKVGISVEIQNNKLQRRQLDKMM